MGKKKKSKKHTNNSAEIWTEEQYEEYLQDLYGMEFIAGFTESGVPFGVFKEDIEIQKLQKSDIPSDPDDEMPF
jgi:hypothetical protein